MTAATNLYSQSVKMILDFRVVSLTWYIVSVTLFICFLKRPLQHIQAISRRYPLVAEGMITPSLRYHIACTRILI